jgi:hypothetical protein
LFLQSGLSSLFVASWWTCFSRKLFVTTLLLDSFHPDLINSAIKDGVVNPEKFLVDPRTLIWKGVLGRKFVDDFLIGVSSDLCLPLDYIFIFLKDRLAIHGKVPFSPTRRVIPNTGGNKPWVPPIPSFTWVLTSMCFGTPIVAIGT